MTLIIEDGTNVAGANSYATLTTIRAYAVARGVTTLSAVDATLEAQVMKAMDYIEAQRSKYQGEQTYKTATVAQALQWPRKNVLIDCIALDDATIPQELIDAEGELTIQIAAGVELYPTTTGNFVIREKIDVIDTSYSEKIGTSSQPNLPSVDRLLDVLFSSCGNANYLSNVRV